MVEHACRCWTSCILLDPVTWTLRACWQYKSSRTWNTLCMDTLLLCMPHLSNGVMPVCNRSSSICLAPAC